MQHWIVDPETGMDHYRTKDEIMDRCALLLLSM